jgi:hypothetical protein
MRRAGERGRAGDALQRRRARGSERRAARQCESKRTLNEHSASAGGAACTGAVQSAAWLCNQSLKLCRPERDGGRPQAEVAQRQLRVNNQLL